MSPAKWRPFYSGHNVDSLSLLIFVFSYHTCHSNQLGHAKHDSLIGMPFDGRDLLKVTHQFKYLNYIPILWVTIILRTSYIYDVNSCTQKDRLWYWKRPWVFVCLQNDFEPHLVYSGRVYKNNIDARIPIRTIFQNSINSAAPSAANIFQGTLSALVQLMACRLFGAKPLPEPMLTYCQLDSYEQTSVKF